MKLIDFANIKIGDRIPASWILFYKVSNDPNVVFNIGIALRRPFTEVVNYVDPKDFEVSRRECYKRFVWKLRLYNKKFSKGAKFRNRFHVIRGSFHAPV